MGMMGQGGGFFGGLSAGLQGSARMPPQDDYLNRLRRTAYGIPSQGQEQQALGQQIVQSASGSPSFTADPSMLRQAAMQTLRNRLLMSLMGGM